MQHHEETQWLVDIYDEHGLTLHRLAVLLGAESESGYIVRSSLLALARRANRVVDPMERIEFVQEMAVHQARTARGNSELAIPSVADIRQEQILQALVSMPTRLSEILVVSHYLSRFGPELASVMRMTVIGANRRLEEALDQMRAAVGDPTPGSLPGVIESLSQEITAALRAAARQVPAPGTDTLRDDLITHRDVSGTRISLWVAIPLLLISCLLGIWVVASQGAEQPQLASPSPVSPDPSVTEARSMPVRVRAVPVYYVGRDDQKLYQESRDLSSSGDIVVAGIEGILAVAPLDPDFRSYWAAGRVLSAEVEDGHMVVDLTADAYESIDSPQKAYLAALQMVYTVSDLVADPELSVSFLMDGGQPPEFFSELNDGITRKGLDPMPLLWITAPQNQQQVTAGRSLIVGTIKPGADTPHVRITNAAGADVFNGRVETASGTDADGWNAWSLFVDLDPGTYTVVATTRTVGEEPAETATDSKTITVQE